MYPAQTITQRHECSARFTPIIHENTAISFNDPFSNLSYVYFHPYRCVEPSRSTKRRAHAGIERTRLLEPTTPSAIIAAVIVSQEPASTISSLIWRAGVMYGGHSRNSTGSRTHGSAIRVSCASTSHAPIFRALKGLPLACTLVGLFAGPPQGLRR